jgi:hypothetical protein
MVYTVTNTENATGEQGTNVVENLGAIVRGAQKEWRDEDAHREKKRTRDEDSKCQ